MSFSFRSCLCKYYPSCPTTPVWLPPEIFTIVCGSKYRPSSPPKDSTVSGLYWHSRASWSLGYCRVKPGEFQRVYKQHLLRCWLNYRPANGNRKWTAVVVTRQSVAKFPAGQTTGLFKRLVLSSVSLLFLANIGKWRPVKNRNVWKRPKV